MLVNQNCGRLLAECFGGKRTRQTLRFCDDDLCDAVVIDVFCGYCGCVNEIFWTAQLPTIANMRRWRCDSFISDFDPAGETMPISVARKIEYFIRNTSNLKDIKLKPLMLTKQQCIDYQFPRTPIKDTDKRKGAFE
ncbi:MAG: hypothetical protein HY808_04885 [Nitrospirae bacterium]|nr:hypothetical protein [Nitrospirota bacterium]